MDSLHERILQHPGNPELNIRFAQLAETSGKLRWALSAYERVLLNDPSNTEALAGLQRVRRALQPNVTLLTVQLGTQYESNPRYYLPPRRPELEAIGSAALLDERNLGGLRWRTNAVAAGLLHARNSDLSYGVAGADTANGTFPVYLHYATTTMTGTNLDGSHYSDPGIPWVSYFNGGDALHGFIRSSYGYPQSLGCVEMTFNSAATMWSRTSIGTLVSVQ